MNVQHFGEQTTELKTKNRSRTETDFHKLNFKYTGNDMRWLLFHQAAYEQRMFLDNKLPKTWMDT